MSNSERFPEAWKVKIISIVLEMGKKTDLKGNILRDGIRKFQNPKVIKNIYIKLSLGNFL